MKTYSEEFYCGAAKMPVRSLLILMLASVATPAPALQPQDTMRDWSAASGADRDRLLKQLGSGAGTVSPKDVSSCINDAAGMDAHADLRITDVFGACTKQAPGERI